MVSRNSLTGCTTLNLDAQAIDELIVSLQESESGCTTQKLCRSIINNARAAAQYYTESPRQVEIERGTSEMGNDPLSLEIGEQNLWAAFRPDLEGVR
jgi:hypothetical protein